MGRVEAGGEGRVDRIAYLLSHFSLVGLFATPWTVGQEAPLSMGFSGQECWTGLPGPPLGDLPGPGIEPVSLRLDSITDRPNSGQTGSVRVIMSFI